MNKPVLKLMIAAMMICASPAAMAQGNEVGIALRFDRLPHDFDEGKATKILIDGAHTFANALILGASYELSTPTGDGKPSHKVESTLGYRWKQNDIFSTRFSAGVGEKWGGGADGFAFYVFRVGQSVKLNDTWTWDAVNYRFREAFDTDNEYTTPEVSTRISYRIDASQSISASYYYDWKEGNADYQGVDIGYKYKF